MARVRVTHPEGGRVMVKQSDQGEADINVIVRRARQGGFLPPPSQTPRYGDFSSFASFHASLNQVRAAEDEFGALPARVRQLCANDLGVFLDKVHTPEGLAELVEAGLPGERVPETARPEPAGETAPAAAAGTAGATQEPSPAS